MPEKIGSDWTQGVICFQSCGHCNHIWYFRRSFCPLCGDVSPVERPSAGQGTVYSRTLVARAPSSELRSFAPYLIVLVDMDEGFRIMAHGDKSLEIGNRVRASFRQFAGRTLPYFEPD